MTENWSVPRVWYGESVRRGRVWHVLPPRPLPWARVQPALCGYLPRRVAPWRGWDAMVPAPGHKALMRARGRPLCRHCRVRMSGQHNAQT